VSPKIKPEQILDILCSNIKGNSHEVLIGLNWTYIRAKFGAGLVSTPYKELRGCHQTPNAGNYSGQPLSDLASLVYSTNIFEKAIGFAAINAYYNRYALSGKEVNGFNLIKYNAEQTVIIGRFPGAKKKFPKAKVIENNPSAGEYPAAAMNDLLPSAKNLIVTASTLSNGTLPAILQHTQPSTYKILVGPSTPMSSDIFKLGFNALSGFIPYPKTNITRYISEGATVSTLKTLGRYLTICSD